MPLLLFLLPSNLTHFPKLKGGGGCVVLLNPKVLSLSPRSPPTLSPSSHSLALPLSPPPPFPPPPSPSLHRSPSIAILRARPLPLNFPLLFHIMTILQSTALIHGGQFIKFTTPNLAFPYAIINEVSNGKQTFPVLSSYKLVVHKQHKLLLCFLVTNL